MHPTLTPPRIPVAGPWITEDDVAFVTDAARFAWQDRANVYHERFERSFADWVGRRHAIALPSCTSALHLALAAGGVGPGDEVIVPELTWIATAAPIVYVGADPVFVDVDPRTWCVDPGAIERAITARTRAVVVVDLYGGMPDMDGVAAVAAAHDLLVIEDAAEAVGAEWRGRRAGAFGRAGAFSFHGSKTLTTGEGGMLVTDDDDLRERCLVLRDHGRAPGDTRFLNEEIAFKYRMSSLQAALGFAQLARIDEIVARKRAIFTRYEAALAGVDGLTLNPEPPGTRNGFWMVTAVWDERYDLDKSAVVAALAAAGIDSRPFFNPLSALPACARLASSAGAARRNPHAYRLAPRGVNLPSGLRLEPGQIGYVAETLRGILRGAV